MKHKPLFILLTFLFIALSHCAFSQNIKSFPNEPDQFIKELDNYFQNVDNRDERKKCKDSFDEFSKEWLAGNFSDEAKELIIKNSNLMLKKKMKVFPHFQSFLQTICAISKLSDKKEQTLNDFLKSVEYLTNSPKSKHFVDYMETMQDIFANNILFQSNTTLWKSDKPFGKFIFDSIPQILYKDIDLICYANKDSTVILKTTGIYFPLDYKWIGRNGKITWKRAGFNEDTVFARFNKYNIITRNSRYIVDSAVFFDKHFFSKPMVGRVTEKVLADVSEERASYPRFDSYDKRIEIKNIFKDIDYNGGFSLYGSKVLGKGDKKQDAILTLKRHKKRNISGKQISLDSYIIKNDSVYKFIDIRSKTFNIHKDKIAAEQASVTVHHGDDSIYHPGLRMKYIQKDRELSLLRYEEGLSQSPYFDTYHKIDMYFEAFIWKMDSGKINFEMIKGPGANSQAIFQSFNYFSLDKYYSIQGIDEVNPLYEIKDYSAKNKTKEFFLEEYSRYIKKSDNSTKALLLTLANMGFLIYNLEDDKIIIKDRLFYYLAAKQKKTDYDVIEFNSVISGKNSNATLNLDNFNLTIRGVDRVSLSDSQKVYIYPTGKQVVLKNNRDFTFNGRVHAGLFDFFGKQFAFSYNNFKLDLPNVDSLTFMVRSFKKDAEGKSKLVRVKSVIEGVSGDLSVDNPKNKSGLKHYPNYPILDSKKNSYVFYHKKYIQKGVYSKEKFFYRIYPFVIDSLAAFTTENLEFKGLLISAGIFPDIEEPLKVQPDYSLGFVKASPAGGYPVYAGKGTFSNSVNLSNKGLRGDGFLNYLASSSKSNEFIFLPDSMNAFAQNFELKAQTAGVEYPHVNGDDVYLHWIPEKDLMKISSLEKPVSMFEDMSKIKGMLYLTPDNLKGSGKMMFKDAEMESKVYKYKNMSFDADSADFSMKSMDQKELSFVTHNYKSHVDFTKRLGNFISNGGGSKVEFPVNQYICFMDEFEWYMDTEELALSDSKNRNANLDNLSMKELIEIDLTGSKFISVNPTQDSLQFFSPKAKYNLKENIIHAQGVKILKVADAAIFPDKGEVTVLKKAEMKPLEHSNIIANTITEYHTIYDASVNITSRKKYSANGKYDYTDENDKKQQIMFDRIGVDSTVQSFALGYLPDNLKFKLSDAFDFKGDVKLIASKEFLTFKGAIKIKPVCDSLTSWLKCNLEVNPKEIYIPVPEHAVDIDKKGIYTGVFYSPLDTSGVYSRFLYKKFNPQDSILAPCAHVAETETKLFLTYDKASDEYRIAAKEKLKTLNLPGRLITLNNNKCIIKSEGEIHFAADFGRVEFNTYGNVKQYIIPDSSIFDLAINTDFYFNDKSIEILTNSLKQNAKLKPVDLNSEKFTKVLYEILGVKEGDKMISEMNLGMGLKKTPSELKKTLFLADVKMKWVPDIKSFVSKGKIGIANIYSEQINKYVNGYIVIKKRKNGDELTIYLEPEATDWYLFSYDSRKKLMSGYSSNKDFNSAIVSSKPDSRKLKSKGEKDSYSYYIATERHRNEFLEMIQNIKY